MTKKFLSLVLTLAMVLGLMVPVALADEDIEVAFSNDSKEISVGESMTATVGDVSVEYDHLGWDYDDCSVSVTLSNGGKTATIKGVSPGLTSIRINAYPTPEDKDPIVSTTFNVTINPAKLSSMSLDKTSLQSLSIGTSVTVTATAIDSNGRAMSDQTFTWFCESSAVSIAGNGNSVTITGREKGNATVTCSVTSDNITKTASCYVYVPDSGSTTTTYKLTGVSLSSKLSLDAGDSDTLKATISGTCDRDDVDFTWTSSNSSVAYVTSDDGEGEYTARIKGKKAGTATITCEAEYNGRSYSDTCKVTVSDDDDDDDDDDDFYISSNLPTSQTAISGVSTSISFTLKNNTDYTANYQWYVDGSKNNSSSKNSFNIGTLSVGTHKVYCEAYTNKGSYEDTTRTCTVTVMAATTTTTTTTSSGSMSNFKAAKTYSDTFTDVTAPTDANPTGDWYYLYVKTAYEYGLVNGKGDAATFCPDDSFTIAEALKIAACIRETWLNSADSAQKNLVDKAGTGADWYKIYLNYCLEKEIIKSGDFLDYNANCTRAQMSYIFSNCLPSSALTAIRTVSVPDCNSNTPYFSNIQTLYNAGVVSGDATHSYYPNDPIKRSEMAKIVCALVVPSTRDKATF